jgi:hypothetical protein
LTFSRVVPAGARGEISSLDAPTANERQALAVRQRDLNAAMDPTDRATIETLVGSLLAGYPAGRGHRDDPDAVMKMFVQALSGLPSWAISSACSAWNRGEVQGKNTSFAPAPSDLRDLALSASSAFTREAMMIGKILGAEVVEERESDELRQAVADRVRAFAATLGASDRKASAPVSHAEDYDAWEARTKADLDAERRKGRLKLSSEALRALSPMMTNAEYDDWLDKTKASRLPPEHKERDQAA